MSEISRNIARLVQYGIDTGLTPACERIYTANLLLDVMEETEYTEPENLINTSDLPAILDALLDTAVKKGLIGDSITERDLFDTKLMNCLLPRPAQVQERFWLDYEKSPQKATDEFYRFNLDSNYIRRDRIKKDLKWTVESDYGTIDITINLSKPEKDPRAIASAGRAWAVHYPACQLCAQNEGYAGRMDHPARENLRIIPLSLDGEDWGLQYSPYVYYNEHCIVLNRTHQPMKIDRAAFRKLVDFLDLFPHYFIGSNADLPIVGGSILSHDHFQGGHYVFAMERARCTERFTVPGYPDVRAGILHWPLSVIRLQSTDREAITELAGHILDAWRIYSDPEAGVLSKTGGEMHNTVTPIARKREGLYELDLALRNNRTTEEFPLGLFHPHPKLHHIKKENIGLIEVMGLAVLPARLKNELQLIKDCILAGGDVIASIRSDERIAKHADWVAGFLPKYSGLNAGSVTEVLQQETGKVFVRVLEDAGVFKQTTEGQNAFLRFVRVL